MKKKGKKMLSEKDLANSPDFHKATHAFERGNLENAQASNDYIEISLEENDPKHESWEFLDHRSEDNENKYKELEKSRVLSSGYSYISRVQSRGFERSDLDSLSQTTTTTNDENVFAVNEADLRHLALKREEMRKEFNKQKIVLQKYHVKKEKEELNLGMKGNKLPHTFKKPRIEGSSKYYHVNPVHNLTRK